jgi:CRISPR-associated protein (TIGR02584 family)
VAEQRHVLLATVGKSPKVVTESLFALTVKNGVKITDLDLITIPNNIESIEAAGLLSPTGPIQNMYKDHDLVAKGYPVLKLGPKNIHIPAGLRSKDLTGTEENAAMEAEITKHIREWTKDKNVVVYALLAGGRKTMSAYMVLAMTIYGREQDKLYHVLHNQPGKTEPDPDWWYPRKGKQAENEWVNLIEIRFPRLRKHIENVSPALLSRPLSEVIDAFDETIPPPDQKEPEICINLQSKKGFLTIDGVSPMMDPRSKMFMGLLAYRKTRKEFCGKVKKCSDCTMRKCALSNEGHTASYGLNEKDISFLKSAYQILKGQSATDSNVNGWHQVDEWTTPASNARTLLRNDFGYCFFYLDSLGRDKPRGERDRCHYLRINRSRISQLN